MIFKNIHLGENVDIDQSTSINNVKIGNNVKISKRCSIFGSSDHIIEIGDDTYIGMNTCLNGYADKLTIGKRVSIAQNVNFMTDSGPNASKKLQRYYPIEKKPITIGDDCWIGVGATIMPGVTLGECCVVAAHSYVTDSHPPYSVIGGSPARLIKKLKAQNG